MTDYEDDLRGSFSSLPTDELLERIGAGTLTETAKAIAAAELGRRGIDATNPDSIAAYEKALISEQIECKQEQVDSAVLRKRSRTNFLIGGMVFILLWRIFERFALGNHRLGEGVEFATSLFGDVVLSGLTSGYIVWWFVDQWRNRKTSP
jgi:hypothetical protein